MGSQPSEIIRRSENHAQAPRLTPLGAGASVPIAEVRAPHGAARGIVHGTKNTAFAPPRADRLSARGRAVIRRSARSRSTPWRRPWPPTGTSCCVPRRRPRSTIPVPRVFTRSGRSGTIIQLLRLPDGTVKVLVEGKSRAKIDSFLDTEKYFLVEVETIEAPKIDVEENPELAALMRQVQATFENYVKLNKRVPPELAVSVQSIDAPSRLADTIAAHVNFKLSAKQELLESESVRARLEKLYELMQNEIEILQVEKKIRTRVKKQMEKNQKEYYLNEQMAGDPEGAGIARRVQKRAAGARGPHPPEEGQQRGDRAPPPRAQEAPHDESHECGGHGRPQLHRLGARPSVGRAHRGEDRHRGCRSDPGRGPLRPREAQGAHLGVSGRPGPGEEAPRPDPVPGGPAGCGQDLLGQVGRPWHRAQVCPRVTGWCARRGRDPGPPAHVHRCHAGQDHPGHSQGWLVQPGVLARRDRTRCPWTSEEIPRLPCSRSSIPSRTWRSWITSWTWTTTCPTSCSCARPNSLHSIPHALRDRMEIIELTGYTEEDKLKIARQYLVPKQLEANGLGEVEVTITDPALRELIHHYTKEAGVRNLEREIASVCRKLARDYVKDKKKKTTFKVDPKAVQRHLGPRKFRFTRAEERDMVGMTNGLAVTVFGGDLLPAEVTITAGKGKVTLTGKLGEVMQESAQAAVTYVRSRCLTFGLEPDFYEHVDFHIHFPEGAVPKDGPSAGVTMVTSVVSALLGISVRKDVAMTGEINLRGKVLPIGGLKEKVLAGLPIGHQDGPVPQRERKGPPRDPKTRPEGRGHQARGVHRRSVALGPGRPRRGFPERGVAGLPGRRRPHVARRLARGPCRHRAAKQGTAGTTGSRPPLRGRVILGAERPTVARAGR